jgi:hypothetical protein
MTLPPWAVRQTATALVLVAAAALIGTAWLGRGGGRHAVTGVTSDPPPARGYFPTRPPGSWSRLPDDRACDRRVSRSVWEPRPDNDAPNHEIPDAAAVHAALRARPRVTAGAYDPRWDRWLLPRVTGAHAGTTDQDIQWAACKWGIADNLLRAVALRESGWFQYEVYPDGRCVPQHGCGDVAPDPDRASRVYCAGLARAGHDYQRDYGAGVCPRTFSLVGVKAWQDPSWGRMRGNQNGTFPFSRDSTAFAVDYLGAFLRGCDEGWVWWLHNVSQQYAPGDPWGCVGVWYSGAWRSRAALHYIRLVRRAVAQTPWLDPAWSEQRPPCVSRLGCPQGAR